MLRRIVRLESLFVGRLPYFATKEEIIKVFPYQVKDITLPMRDETEGKNKGFAFINFVDESDANKAISDHATTPFKLNDYELNLDLGNKPREERSKNPVPTREIFVGNLPYTTTEADLSEMFKNGQVNLIKDRRDNSSKGFAFILFESVTEATEALNKAKEIQIEGRALKLDYGNPKI